MLIKTVGQWKGYIENLKWADKVYFDLETNGLEAWGASHIVGIALKAAGIPGVYAPFRHASGNLPLELMQDLAPIFENKMIVGHNIGFDLRFAMKEGLPLPKRIRDTMVGSGLLDCNESHALKKLGDKYVTPDASKAEEELEALLAAHKLRSKADMWQLEPSRVAAYASQDVNLTEALEVFQTPHLERWKLTKLYEDRCDYLRILLKAERRGFQLDRKLVEEYRDEAARMQSELSAEISALAGETVNPNSPKQMSKLLGVASTASKIIEKLSGGDRRAAALLDFRGWAKLHSTYYEAFLNGVDVKNVLRACFRIMGTVAGRLSMSDPNLQALPAYDEMYRVKDVFIARPGYTLAEIDYSAMELRLAAHFTQEPGLVEAFRKNESPHDSVATKMGIDRKTAKTLNFSILYGAGPKRIAEQFNLEKIAAGGLLASYWRANPLIYRWKEAVQEKARRTGYIRLWSGLVRRYLPETGYVAGKKPKAQPHTSPNNVIQGSGAAIIQRATQRLDQRLDGQDAHLLLQVHDSLVFEIRDEILNAVLPIIRDTMQDNPEFSIPMLVDIKVGKSWGRAVKYE